MDVGPVVEPEFGSYFSTESRAKPFELMVLAFWVTSVESAGSGLTSVTVMLVSLGFAPLNEYPIGPGDVSLS